MMEQLQITLKPINDIDIDSYFIINLEDENQRPISLRSTFVKQRTRNNQIELGSTIEQTMDNALRSIELDYQTLFTAEKISSTSVLLKSKLPVKFGDFTSFNPIKKTPILDSEVIYVPINSINITSVEYLPATSSQCTKCRVRIEFNRNGDAYCLDSTCFPINTDFVEFEVFRGSTHLFRVMRGTFMAQRTLSVPESLQSLSGSIYVNVVNAPSGSTGQVIVPNNNLQLEYSLNNQDWQEEN